MPSTHGTFSRTKDGFLQLAFLTLRRNDREVALMTVIDLATKEYFERIARHIKKREQRGFAIIYEDPASVDMLIAESGNEKAAQGAKEAAIASLQKSGVAYFSDEVQPADYWVKVSAPDMQLSDLAVARDKYTDRLKSITSGPKTTATSVQTFPLSSELYDLLPRFGDDFDARRCAQIASAIEAQADQYNVYALVNLDRVAHILTTLEAGGFHITQQQWMDVMAVETS
jgi:hypothetical protein